MPISGPSIRIDQNTTRKDLQDFLVNDAKDGTRLLGKKDSKTGAITLYTSDSRAGLLSRMTGKAASRRADAREAMNMVLTSYQQKAAGKGLTAQGAEASEILFKNVATRTQTNDKSALRTDKMRTALADVKSVVGLLPRATAVALAPMPALPPGPRLYDALAGGQADVTRLAFMLGNAALTTTINADDKLVYSDSFKQLAQSFGDAIATGYSQGRSNADRVAFAMSDGAALKTQLRNELDRAMPQGAISPKMRDAFVTQVFNHAAANITDDRATGVSHTIDVKGAAVALPEIVIGGRTFVPKQHLGTGGFAEVYKYEASDKQPTDPADDSNTIAFKIPNAADDGDDAAIRAAANEVATHRAAMGNGHDNVIGLKAAIRLPGGIIGVAIQVASGGDSNKVADKITAAVGSGKGKISRDEADILRFTMLKDMTKGLKQIRDNNLMHLDFKTPNCLVGADGTTKISDFGLTKAGTQTEAKPVLAEAQNVFYISPEMATAQQDVTDIANDAAAAERDLRDTVRERLGGILVSASPEDISFLISTISQPKSQVINDEKMAKTAAIQLTAQSDTFNLGIAAYNIFTGNPLELGNHSFSTQTEGVLAQFNKSPGAVAIATDPATGRTAVGSLSPATHNADADALMNRLMDPVPANRPSLDAVLTSSAFFAFDDTLETKAHSLIAAIAKGDPDAIDAARADLATLL